MLQGAPVSPPQDPHGALLLGAAHRPLLAHHGLAAGLQYLYLQYLQYIYYIYNIYIYTSIPESISIPIHLFQNLIRTDYFESVLSVLCVSEVIVRYFHLTTFFWMFLEGKLVLPIYNRVSFGAR